MEHEIAIGDGSADGRRSDRTVLLIAFHFPPIQGSSGVQRTLRFAQHLPTFGWRPVVLTIVPEAYEAVRPASGNEIPAERRGAPCTWFRRRTSVELERALSAHARDA